METFQISADGVRATIKAAGAELCSLQGADGAELLWQAGPAWPRHAPVLFPIVGRLANDTLRHGGRTFRMTQHGFARDRRFAWIEQSPDKCRLRLVADETSLTIFPFPFQLDLVYAVTGATLTQTFEVTNTGDATLPASVGAHPAFVWPLRPGLAKEAHTLTFSADETAPLRQVAGGLMRPETVPNPIQGRVLALREDLFAHDALILDPVASRSVRYSAPGGPAITVAWEGMPQLGIWTKPADFLCIEPWHGFASPENFDGAFADKPGLMLIAPGQTATASLSITNSSNPD